MRKNRLSTATHARLIPAFDDPTAAVASIKESFVFPWVLSSLYATVTHLNHPSKSELRRQRP
jgi:hypothetical protein